MSKNRYPFARLAAPAAFLLAATVAIVIVRSAVSDETAAPAATTARQTSTSAKPKPQPATKKRPRATPKREFYEIRAGDTLEVVATRYDTTVERLLVLNPDVDPVALTVGQRIRVK